MLSEVQSLCPIFAEAFIVNVVTVANRGVHYQWALPETWGTWETSPTSGPRKQHWTRTVSAACQSLCSACSWPKPAGCTDGFSQTPDRCSAWAARYRTGPLETKSTHTYTQYWANISSPLDVEMLVHQGDVRSSDTNSFGSITMTPHTQPEPWSAVIRDKKNKQSCNRWSGPQWAPITKIWSQNAPRLNPQRNWSKVSKMLGTTYLPNWSIVC